MVVAAALFAVNWISSRVERSSVESRLEQESEQTARVGSFRVVEQMSTLATPGIDDYLHIPDDASITDRIVLNAFAGQSVVRVDIVGPDGTVVYSTDPAKRGSLNALDSVQAASGSSYIGPAMMSPLGEESKASEVVVSKVPIPREGAGVPNPGTDFTFMVYRDVTTAIDAATASGNQARILMVLGVMAVLFASLLGVVWRGHSMAAAARRQLQALLNNERELASELDSRNEELRAAIDAKNQVLSIVTHELNNPITAISAYSDLLSNNRRGNLSERDLKQAEAIGRSAQQMGGLVSDLLDYSRIEASTIELEVEEHDVTALIEETAETMTPILDSRDQVIELDLPSGSLPANIDRGRCEQILSNLLSNASKYSPEGATITMGCLRVADRIEITVADRGIGISIEDQERLFTPFFRADNKETRQVKGTGLGLMISRQLAELHGGSLALDSAPGRGTRVTFALPAARS